MSNFDAETMVERQIIVRGVRDESVLQAMKSVDRRLFVQPKEVGRAFGDHPMPIGHGQTISQPYVVAAMTEALRLRATDKVLEIGTGSGYQTAVLAEIVREVWTVEIVEPLALGAKSLLRRLGYTNLHCRTGDGAGGWPTAAPFDKIIVTAAPPQIPDALLDQLAPAGLLVIPVGSDNQELLRVCRGAEGLEKEHLFGVRFVPMTGLASG